MVQMPKNLIAMANVADVEKSIAFYQQLGLKVENTYTPEGETAPTWAELEAHDAALMLAKTSERPDPPRQGVLFYVYFDDIASKHAELTAAGLAPGPLTYPFYCPRGEFPLTDPDGYCLMCTHT